MTQQPDASLNRQAAFTLVEISVVLVILALLAGGIMAGQYLIRTAELRSVPLEYQKFQSAVYNFKNKYRAKPGDMANATRFWGAANSSGAGGNCANPTTDIGPEGTETCNGNGNGLAGETYEQLRFWQHLSNAGLIEGQYTGVQGSGGYLTHVIGENTPGSKVPSAGWATVHLDANSESYKWNVPDVRYQTTFFGGQSNGGRYPDSDVFTAEELWGIDNKIDDGKPGSGFIRTRAFDTCTNASSRNDADVAEYDFDSDTRCSAIFHDMY